MFHVSGFHTIGCIGANIQTDIQFGNSSMQEQFWPLFYVFFIKMNEL